MEMTARTKTGGPRALRQAQRTVGSELGAWIRAKRADQNVSQRELADLAGISRSYLCDIERGRGTKPSVECLDSISAALGVDRMDLLREAGILDPNRDPEENSRERKLLAVFRGLSDPHQEELERFARFLLSEEQHWVQPRLVDGAERTAERGQRGAGPTLFDRVET